MASGPLITTINDISIHALREEGDHDGVVYKVALICISIHALREEGDVIRASSSITICEFLSTPSARRATNRPRHHRRRGPISIHALREEGDVQRPAERRRTGNFYPRPPRGGRHTKTAPKKGATRISIHALREEGDAVQAKNSGTYTISIHALREEGDYASRSLSLSVILFLSTPSARRATRCHLQSGYRRHHFYPRPPRGGRLLQAVLVHNVKDISIHALREEGDDATIKVSPRSRQFLSTPSARRATCAGRRRSRWGQKFLSTPSARRATKSAVWQRPS